jgi:hypothetical protein
LDIVDTFISVVGAVDPRGDAWLVDFNKVELLDQDIGAIVD